MLAFFAADDPHPITVTEYLHRGGGDVTVERLVLGYGLMAQFVLVPEGRPHHDAVPRPHRRLHLRLERHPGEADEVHHDPEVHDVPAIATAVAADEPGKRQRVALSVKAMARPHPPAELLDDAGPSRRC